MATERWLGKTRQTVHTLAWRDPPKSLRQHRQRTQQSSGGGVRGGVPDGASEKL